jgi:NAD(P)-dependent dehydrogenase (short-subunit alcohol dehydrogenase family)
MAALDGRVAVVTGASRGIELGAAGATVYLTGRTTKATQSRLPGSIDDTARDVDAIGGRGVPVACDHRDDEAVEALFEQVRAESGRLDVLVNNAFLIPRELTSGRPFWQTPLSNWDDMIDVGTRSAYAASRHAAAIMVAQGSGLIVNISSSGAGEYAWHVAYGVGKCALDRFTADAAHELRPHGVAVVSLWPGLVLTERNQRAKESVPGLDFSGAESLRFTGRAVVALATDDAVLERSGGAFASRDLADAYGFTDVDGSLPDGPLHHRPAPAGHDSEP